MGYHTTNTEREIILALDILNIILCRIVPNKHFLLLFLLTLAFIYNELTYNNLQQNKNKSASTSTFLFSVNIHSFTCLSIMHNIWEVYSGYYHEYLLLLLRLTCKLHYEFSSNSGSRGDAKRPMNPPSL